MPIQVPMYTPRIPIRGGGGVIDLSAKENQSKRLIAQAIGQILGSMGKKPQQEQDMAGQVVVSEGKTWLVDRKTGQKIDLGLKANPRVEELLKLIDMARKYEKPSGVETAISESAEEELLGVRGLERYEEEPGVPGEKRYGGIFGLDITAKDRPAVPAKMGIRKKVESRVVGEPTTRKEFEAEVTRLGQIDREKAKVYYDKWSGKWR